MKSHIKLPHSLLSIFRNVLTQNVFNFVQNYKAILIFHEKILILHLGKYNKFDGGIGHQ